MATRNNFIDKLLARFGYVKQSRTWPITVMPWEKSQGISLPEDYEAYALTYRDIIWVYVCVNKIATAGASVPFRIYRRIRDDDVEELTDHPAVKLFYDVNPFMSSYDLWEGTFAYPELQGNCYWELVRDRQGNIREIYFLRPDRVRVVPDEKRGVVGYIYEYNGKRIALEARDVIHFKNWNPNSEWYGQSSLSAARSSAVLDRLATQYNRKFFSAGARPDGILTPEDPDVDIGPDERERIRAEWQKLHGGVENAHRIAILTGGLKYQSVQLPPKDVEFLKLKQLTKAEIAAAFGVPMPLIDQERSTYDNYKSAQKDFWQNTMVPKLRKVARTVTEQLLQPYFGEDLFAEFDVSAVEALREDEEKLTNVDVKLVESGLATINERRQRKGLEPVPWGDTWYKPINLVPVLTGSDTGDDEPPDEGDDEEPDEESKLGKLSASSKWGLFRGKGGWKLQTPPREKTQKQTDWQNLPVITYDPNDPRVVQTRALEDDLIAALKRFWQNEQNHLLRHVRENWEKEISQEDMDLIDQLLEELGQEGLERLLRSYIFQAMEDGGILAYNELGMGADWELVDPNAKLFLEEYPNFLANEKYNGIRERLRETLIEGIERGESVVLLQDRISAVYNQLKGIDAERIARTEMVKAANRGKLAGYMQSGVVRGKQWIAVLDDRTCPFCEGMGGKIQSLESNFWEKGDVMEIDGSTLKFDYEAILTPPLHPMCRCTLVPVLD